MSRLKKYPQEVKARSLLKFINNISLAQIAKEENINFDTLRTWHNKYNWADEKRNFKAKTNEKIIEQSSTEQAKKSLDEVAVIDFAVAKLITKLKDTGLKAKSVEEVAKAIFDGLKVKGTYTGKTVQKQELEHKGLDFGEAVKQILSHRHKRTNKKPSNP